MRLLSLLERSKSAWHPLADADMSSAIRLLDVVLIRLLCVPQCLAFDNPLRFQHVLSPADPTNAL